MKIPPSNRERGAVAVVVMLGLLAILLMLMNANSRSTRHLNRELQRLDERQAAHWQRPATIPALAP
jgi:hypothetical protein